MMTSKENLETLYNLYGKKSMPCISVYEQELWDSIEKDLEILEKIKSIIEDNAGFNDIDTLNKIWEIIKQ